MVHVQEKLYVHSCIRYPKQAVILFRTKFRTEARVAVERKSRMAGSTMVCAARGGARLKCLGEGAAARPGVEDGGWHLFFEV